MTTETTPKSDFEKLRSILINMANSSGVEEAYEDLEVANEILSRLEGLCLNQ